MVHGTFPDAYYGWQIDGAPCDMEKKTPVYLPENMANLRGKDMRPPKLPDSNSREYSIRAHLEQKAYKKPHPSVDVLWANISRPRKKMNEVHVKMMSMIAKNGVNIA